ARRVTFNGDGVLSGVSSSSEDVTQALGDTIGFGVAGRWEAGQPLTLAQLRLAADALSLEMAGQIADAVFTGDIALTTDSVAPFSGLAGRDLSGAVTLSASGSLSPLIGGFDLTLDGTGTNLAIGDRLADD